MADVYNYWNEFKKSISPEFSKWIGGEFNSDAANWSKSFAYYITDKNDKQMDKNGRIINKDGKVLKRDVVTNTKLRKFFGHLKKLELKVKYYHTAGDVNFKKEEDYVKALLESELPLLKARIAYDAGREKDPHHKLVDFYFFIEEVLKYVKDKYTFLNFIKMSESIVAFVKAYENEVFIMNEK